MQATTATGALTDELMTVGEVARVLRVAESTVRKWIARDEVPYLTLPGGDYRVPRTELFGGLAGNVDGVAIMRRLTARLESVADETIDEEIRAVRDANVARR